MSKCFKCMLACQPCLCVGMFVHASCGLFWLLLFGVDHALAVRAEFVVLAPEKDEN